jgi:molybdopterin-dependent oxidoreductase alpha subunit
MGGQRGGMVNETGHFPEVCKKSLQAMVADMQPGVPSDFWHRRPIGRLRQMTPRELENAGRLAHPVLYTRESGHYAPLSWDRALGIVADKLKATLPKETFWYFSGRSSNEAGFLLQLFARLYGTNNVNNCSYYCHQASGAGLSSSIGTGTATLVLEDLDQSDLIFVIGANPASNHPRLLETLRKVRKRGGDVIVINPLREPGLEKFHVPSHPWSLLFGSEIASSFVQPHIGGDLALLTGIAKRVVELEAHEPGFVALHCSGWSEWADSLANWEWDHLCDSAGVDFATIDRVARRYAASENTVFAWAMGITHHANGVENVQAIANLALLRGMVGKPGSGLMPIRGHSNVQGMGSVGVTPSLKKAVFDALESRLDVSLPTEAGLDTMACMEASAEGAMKVAINLGGNLYGSNPDASFAASAMRNLDLTVYLSTTLNTGHAWGAGAQSIILPVLARDEEPEATTQESMFNFVRLSDGGAARLEGPRSEVQVIADLAERVLEQRTPVDFGSMRSTRNIRKHISAVIPGYAAIGEIDDSKEEFQIEGRTLHEPAFPTETGLARLHVHTELSRQPPESGELRLMTIRSEGQFNTVVYEEEDLYRGISARDVVLLHPADLASASLESGDEVTVHGPAGSMAPVTALSFERLRPGNAAMYFPEANRLLSHEVDPKSRTPAFKGARIRLEAL